MPLPAGVWQGAMFFQGLDYLKLSRSGRVMQGGVAGYCAFRVINPARTIGLPFNGTGIDVCSGLDQTQPEIHIRAHNSARYDTVVTVMASASRSGLMKLGLMEAESFDIP